MSYLVKKISLTEPIDVGIVLLMNEYCFLQRKDYSALKTYLPQKEEYVIPVRLSALQIELYRKYLQISRSNDQTATRGSQLFSDYQNLMRIWTHPWVLHMEELRRQKNVGYIE